MEIKKASRPAIYFSSFLIVKKIKKISAVLVFFACLLYFVPAKAALPDSVYPGSHIRSGGRTTSLMSESPPEDCSDLGSAGFVNIFENPSFEDSTYFDNIVTPPYIPNWTSTGGVVTTDGVILDYQAVSLPNTTPDAAPDGTSLAMYFASTGDSAGIYENHFFSFPHNYTLSFWHLTQTPTTELFNVKVNGEIVFQIVNGTVTIGGTGTETDNTWYHYELSVHSEDNMFVEFSGYNHAAWDVMDDASLYCGIPPTPPLNIESSGSLIITTSVCDTFAGTGANSTCTQWTTAIQIPAIRAIQSQSAYHLYAWSIWAGRNILLFIIGFILMRWLFHAITLYKSGYRNRK